MNAPILRTQSDILSLANNLTLNTAHNRWTDVQVYAAMNMALAYWYKRVQVPFFYTVPGGFINTSLEYTLPDYMEGPMDVQSLRYQDYPYLVTTLDGLPMWFDIDNYSIEANATGGRTLRLGSYYYSSEARILWYGYNGPVPTTIPTLNAGIDADDTTLTLASIPTVGRSGYIKIGSEWMQYAGTAEGAITLTLSNLVRGVNGTTAASHLTAASVEWGVSMDRGDLLNALLDSTRRYMMELKLMEDSTIANDVYKNQLNYYEGRDKVFWRAYAPSRAPKFRLGPRGM